MHRDFTYGKIKGILEVDGGDGFITRWLYLISPKYILKRG